MDTKFPLRECDVCMFQNACEHQGRIQQIIDEGVLPIDFSTATCNEFIPVQIDEIMDDMEDLLADIARPGADFMEVLSQLMEAYYEKGMVPVALHVHPDMMEEIEKVVGKDAQEIETKYGKIDLVLDDTAPEDSFCLASVYGRTDIP
jgi:hypothetical protein